MRGDSHRERAACPLYTAIGVIEGRWKPMLFQRLSDRPHGFGELRRAMPGVAAKVLREQLRQMQADDLVTRRSFGPAHAGVLVGLTPYGRTLGPVFDTLCGAGAHVTSRGPARRKEQSFIRLARERASASCGTAGGKRDLDANAQCDSTVDRTRTFSLNEHAPSPVFQHSPASADAHAVRPSEAATSF